MDKDNGNVNIISLEDCVPAAIRLFNNNESYLLKNNLSERCICARFAMCLSSVIENTNFSSYYVDVEYNRGALGDTRIAKLLDGRKIYCDLIVHKRGYDENIGFDNLICIEMKKSTSRVGTAADEERLRQLTSWERGFRYKLGYMIIIDLDETILKIKQIYRLSIP